MQKPPIPGRAFVIGVGLTSRNRKLKETYSANASANSIDFCASSIVAISGVISFRLLRLLDKGE